MASTCVFHIYFVAGLLLSDAMDQKDFLGKWKESSLSDLLSGHASAVSSTRLAAIEASIWQTFQSLPKNKMGRLAPPAVRHIVHGYFAREHGWQITGLEAQGFQVNTTEDATVHDMSILHTKAPALVEGLVGSRHQDHGFALTEIVAMCAILEQLIFDESITLLETAYRFNAASATKQLDEADLHRVLKSYLVLFAQGVTADLSDADYHHKLLKKATISWEKLFEFERNAVSNFEYARRHLTNPFVPRTYSFETAKEIVGDMAQRYGKWQDGDCREIKSHMAQFDPEYTGRVPLGRLYAENEVSKSTAHASSFEFMESADYLRKIGALDETTSTPKVIIANYLAGPSNCLELSSFYSLCCLSSCDSIMNEIEHQVLASSASSDVLLNIVRNMSHGQELPSGLMEKLNRIAERHGGLVPLHGRLFAQWLHFAFPHDCSYPTLLKEADALASSQYSQWAVENYYAASEEDLLNHTLSSDVTTDTDIEVDDLWSDHEVLSMHDDVATLSALSVTTLIRGTGQLAAVLGFISMILAAWNAAGKAGEGKYKKHDAKAEDLVLGFRV